MTLSNRELTLLQLLFAALGIWFVYDLYRYRDERWQAKLQWWNSEEGAAMQCAYDFVRYQNQVWTGMDFGCTQDQILRYVKNSGFGFDPFVNTIYISEAHCEYFQNLHKIDFECSN